MDFLSEIAKKFVFYTLCLLSLATFLIGVNIAYSIILGTRLQINTLNVLNMPSVVYFISVYTVSKGKVLENLGDLKLDDFLKRTATAFILSIVVAAVSRACGKNPGVPLLIGGFSFYCMMYLFYMQRPSGETVRPGRNVRGVAEVKQPRPNKKSSKKSSEPGQSTQPSPEEIERRLGKDL